MLTKNRLVNKLTSELGNYEIIDEARKKKMLKPALFYIFMDCCSNEVALLIAISVARGLMPLEK